MASTTVERDFRRVLRPGTVEVDADGRGVSVFVKVEYSGGRLSLSGVEGPKGNGDCFGSCGQIDMGYAHRDPADDDRRYTVPKQIKTFADGWDAETWFELLDVWKRWHLNDMSPACEHQRALGWGRLASEEVTLYFWRLRGEVRAQVRDAERAAVEALRRGESVSLPSEVLELASLPDRVTTAEDAPPSELYEANGPVYEGDHYNRASERKTRGWVKPSEHPDGLLTAPCPECGYAYGSEWRREDVPAEVLEFLQSLPSADRAPAWV